MVQTEHVQKRKKITLNHIKWKLRKARDELILNCEGKEFFRYVPYDSPYPTKE